MNNKKAQFPPVFLFVLFVIVVIISGIIILISNAQMNGYCRECGFSKMTGNNIQNSSITKIECDKVHYIYKEITENTLTDKWGYPYLNRTEQLNCRRWNG